MQRLVSSGSHGDCALAPHDVAVVTAEAEGVALERDREVRTTAVTARILPTAGDSTT
jgi:hypothetical protein